MGQIIIADALEGLRHLETETCDTCITSPPYYGLRDYGVEGQIGIEKTPEQYINRLVEVFSEVRRVLKPDGTLWLNIGDSYAGSGKGGQSGNMRSENWQPRYPRIGETARKNAVTKYAGDLRVYEGIKNKDLIGIPWMLAFALRADGWWLRQDIIWHKPNAMPESVKDRCTKSHEHILLLSKSRNYYYDNEAIKEPCARKGNSKTFRGGGAYTNNQSYKNSVVVERQSTGNKLNQSGKRNRRDVWTVATKPYNGAHFSVFPPELIRPCILAGSRKNGIVLDPFLGSGTTAIVAVEEGRDFIGIDLNPNYVELVRKRMGGSQNAKRIRV